MKEENLERYDKLGILCSSACALHCTLPPLLLLISPAATSFLENEWIHLALLILVIPISIFSFLSNRKRHKKNLPLILGLVGIAFLVSAVLSESLFHVEVEGLEQALTLVGCIDLVSAHLLNIKYLRSR